MKKRIEKISIVICTYNGMNFISAQLDSILAQTYPIYEIIIQDDNSDDATWDIIQQYAQRYPKIKAFRNSKNLGVNHNFFTAFEKVTGDYIAISDQDDIWLPKKIEKQICTIGDSWLSASMTKPFAEKDGAKVFFDNRKLNRNLERIIFCPSIAGHTMLFRKSFLSKLSDWKYWTSYKTYDYYMDLVAEAYEKVSFLDEVLVLQRRYLGAVTYTEPLNYKKSSSNMMNYLKRTLLLYKNDHIRQYMDSHFMVMSNLLESLTVQTSSRNRALRLARNMRKHSAFSKIYLMFLCVQSRDRIFYTKEKNFLLSIVRALYFPISCCEYFRYILKDKE